MTRTLKPSPLQLASFLSEYDVRRASTASSFEGEASLETVNSVYCFVDGVCCAAMVRRDARSSAAPPRLAHRLLGMRIVGWVTARHPLSPSLEWRPGLHALLFSSQFRAGRDSYAITSPSVDFSGATNRPSHDSSSLQLVNPHRDGYETNPAAGGRPLSIGKSFTFGQLGSIRLLLS